MKKIYSILMISAIVSCTSSNQTDKIKLMTLDPGHFHASLIQKTSYENIDLTVDVYAPEGSEVNSFLNSIDAYNNREENPTNWKINSHLGNNYLEKMIAEKPGNVMVVSGKKIIFYRL